MIYIIDANENTELEKICQSIGHLDAVTADDSDIDYKALYLFLFNRVSDISNKLKHALDSNDPQLIERAAPEALAGLWGAQSDAEGLLLLSDG